MKFPKVESYDRDSFQELLKPILLQMDATIQIDPKEVYH